MTTGHSRQVRRPPREVFRNAVLKAKRAGNLFLASNTIKGLTVQIKNLLLLTTVIFLSSCSNTPYDPYQDEKISNSKVCQTTLKTLADNNVFTKVKNLVDRECNNIIRMGWVDGKMTGKANRMCIANFSYIKERPQLLRSAKRFIMNECYPENRNKYFWKTPQTTH